MFKTPGLGRYPSWPWSMLVSWAGNGRAGEKAGTPCLKPTTTYHVSNRLRCPARRGGCHRSEENLAFSTNFQIHKFHFQFSHFAYDSSKVDIHPQFNKCYQLRKYPKIYDVLSQSYESLNFGYFTNFVCFDKDKHWQTKLNNFHVKTGKTNQFMWGKKIKMCNGSLLGI